MRPTASIMCSEIDEQPAKLRETLAALLPRTREIAALGRETRQVLFIARGSSDNAAVYGSYLIQAHCGRLTTLASPFVATTYGAELDLSGVLAVAVSQSGRTGEIVETMRWAARCGARTVAVTNVAGSPLAQESDIALVTRAGDELAVPATKTYTTQLAAHAVLALGLGADLDHGQLSAVPDTLEAHLGSTDERVAEVVEGLVGVHGAVVSGRGMALSTALEMALKLKEACYLHAMGLSYADLLHGPIAVVDGGTPAILVAASYGPTLPGTLALAERVSSAGAAAIGVGGGSELRAACDLTVPAPDLPEWLAPMGLALPAQTITERLARRLGYNPDTPRGLGKVTQTS